MPSNAIFSIVLGRPSINIGDHSEQMLSFEGFHIGVQLH